MFDLIKLRVLRWIVRVVLARKWKGQVATGIDTRGLHIQSGATDIAARLYRPHGVQRALPVLLFFHGGGWVGFDLDTHDPLCRDLCSRSGFLVISVDYRLAPEHPFPAAVNDCLGALDWLQVNVAELGGDAQRVFVGGDSAGGNLAAIVTLQARRRHAGFVKGQVLIYPVTDHHTTPWPSYVTRGGRGYPLTHKGVTNLWRLYTQHSSLWTAGQTQHELATPYRVTDVTGLPPSFVAIADEDMLRDEGLAYAAKMSEAGAEVTVKIYPNQKHGFVGGEPSAAHREAVEDIAVWLVNLGRHDTSQPTPPGMH